MKKLTIIIFSLGLYTFLFVSFTLLTQFIIAGIKQPDFSLLETFIITKSAELRYGDDDLRKDTPQMEALQNQYDVQTYKLELSMDIPKKEIYGVLNMNAQNLSDTLNRVYINLLENMKTTSVSLNGEDVTYTRNENYIMIDSRGKLSKFSNFDVTIKYEGVPANKGFDSFGFKTFDGLPAVYTLSEPTYAPTWWPCKDIISDKSQMEMIVTVEQPLVVGSNGLLIEETKHGDETTTYHWKTSYPISTYLVSLAIGKYDKWTDYYTSLDGVTKMPVEYYTYPSYTEKAKKDWANTVEMIEFFSRTFGEYPFINEKYGMALFGWIDGAMEHQTLSSMGYRLVTGERTYEAVTVHELGHQWFGDAVTPETWKDIWLNEGFASYSEALWEENNGGKTALRDYMLGEDYGFFQGTVYNPEGFIFGPTVYQKGSWCLHMLRGVTGDSTFFSILRTYYDEYKYKNANTRQFKEVCERVSGMNLDNFFDQWIFEGTGRPDYEVSWRSDKFDGQAGSNAYMLRLNIEQTQKKWDVYKMPVKITVVTDKGEQELTFFNDKRVQMFEHPVDGKPIDVIIDKDSWILKTVKKVEYKDKI